MSHKWSEWKDVEEGSDDSVYSVHQVLSFLKGAYIDRDYNRAEKLLMLREERIKMALMDDVKKLMYEMEKKIEVQERLRKEVEKALDVKVESEEKLSKECEDLKKENLRLRRKVADVVKDEKERVKELELKVEVEVGWRKKAEEQVEVWMKKFYELDSKVLRLTKDVDLLTSSEEADVQGSEMEVDAEVQPTVRSSCNLFAEGANSANPISAAKHEPRNCIEISSSSDDDPYEVQIRSKDKSDLSPVKLDFEIDHGSPEVSPGLKRRHMSSVHEDNTESIPQTSTGERRLSKLQSESPRVQPSSITLTPPPGFGTVKPVNSGQAEGVTPPPGFGTMKPVNLGQAKGASRITKVSSDDEWENVNNMEIPSIFPVSENPKRIRSNGDDTKRGACNGSRLVQLFNTNGKKKLKLQPGPKGKSVAGREMASHLASAVGRIVRDAIPMSAESFDKNNLSNWIILQDNLGLYFELDSTKSWLKDLILETATNQFRNWKYQCKNHYVANGADLPYEFVDRPDEWRWLITHFRDPKYMQKCARMTSARLCKKRNHHSGRVSFEARAAEFREQNDRTPIIAAFSKAYSHDSDCQQIVDQMKEKACSMLEERSGDLDGPDKEVEPLTTDEELQIIDQVIGSRKGTQIFGKTFSRPPLPRGGSKGVVDSYLRAVEELDVAKSEVALAREEVFAAKEEAVATKEEVIATMEEIIAVRVDAAKAREDAAKAREEAAKVSILEERLFLLEEAMRTRGREKCG